MTGDVSISPLVYCLARLSSRRERDGVQGVDGGIFNLAICEYHFIRVYENLVQHPSNIISLDIFNFPLNPGIKSELFNVKC